MVNFLCPRTNLFIVDFKKCENCDIKGECLNYNYEKNFNKKYGKISN